MHHLTRWFIHNPVAANLVMLLIIFGGLLTLSSIRIEGFPKLPADTLTIDTTYADAYAEQVDRQITQKIEFALQGLPGVKKIQSFSLEGLSSIQVQKQQSYKLQRLLDDVRVRLEGIYGLPKASDKPVISRNDFDFPALIVQLYGETDTKTLQKLGRRMREALLAQPEISKLKTWGERSAEIRIEVRPDRLEKYDLTIADIVEKIQQSSFTFKAGSLKTEGGVIALRADNQAMSYRDFASIPVFELSDGSQLLLGDLAAVKDTYEDDDSIVRFNGLPALGMEVLIGRKENLLDIAAVVKKVVADFQTVLPPEVALTVWADSSDYISDRLNLLRSNAIQGLLLVFILLALFLDLKLAFWVAMGVPISVTGALAAMGSVWVDYSLNDITTFGLIISLGILVDDAVVVGESVFTQRKQYEDPAIGTETGVQRVATATIFGVLTTVAAFFPMMLIDSALGKVMASFAGVVILTLLFSLAESKFLLPSHLAHISLVQHPSRGWLSRGWRAAQKSAQGGLDFFNEKVYRPALEWSLKQRYAVFVLFLSFAALGIGLMATGTVKTVFFPDIPGQVITVDLEMDARSPYRLILQNANRIEAEMDALNNELMQSFALEEKPVRQLLVVIESAFSLKMYAELTPPSARRGVGTLDVVRKWQHRVGMLGGASRLTFTAAEEAAGGFVVELYSKNQDELKTASKELMDYLHGIKGISHVRDALKNGKPQLSLKLKPGARHLGFSDAVLATQISQRFGGAEAQRIQRDNQEVRVIVRNQNDARNTLSDLIQTRIKSDNGKWYPLSAIAVIKSMYAADYIARRDGKRANFVQARIDKNVVAPSEIDQDLFGRFVPELKQRFPQVDVGRAGELEQLGEIRGGLVRALIFTCVLIYALLAIPLKSYWQPLVVMSVIPFGFAGASLGHLIMDLPFSLLSFLGMLALAGVVVNDSLVIMTRYNQARFEGETVHASLISSGVGRLRAIFLTTATTVAGLTPLMNETSEQAQYLIPAAVSLAWGEIFATAITLVLIPVLMAIGADVQAHLRSKPSSLSRP